MKKKITLELLLYGVVLIKTSTWIYDEAVAREKNWRRVYGQRIQIRQT